MKLEEYEQILKTLLVHSLDLDTSFALNIDAKAILYDRTYEQLVGVGSILICLTQGLTK
jgi:hypothetical protein